MARKGYQVWTVDMVIGAAIVIIGLVATLVRMNVLILKWSFSTPAMVSHLWPLLMIGVGVVLLLENIEQMAASRRSWLSGGERQ